MKILRGILLGGVAMWSSQAFAADDASEIRALQARLKQLEQRIESQARRDQAQTKTAVKVPSPFDPCPAGKGCYKGVALTFGGFLDLTDIYRTRNLSSDVGSVYNAIPFAGNRNYNVAENRFSARTSRLSLLVWRVEMPPSPEFRIVPSKRGFTPLASAAG